MRKVGMLVTFAILLKSATSVARKKSFLVSSFAASPAAGRTSLNWRGSPRSWVSLPQRSAFQRVRTPPQTADGVEESGASSIALTGSLSQSPASQTDFAARILQPVGSSWPL